MIHNDQVSGYAMALTALAIETKQQKQFKNNLKEMQAALKKHPQFIDLLNSGQLSKEDKITSTQKVFKNIHQYIVHLILILAFKRQAKFLEKIMKKTITLLNDELDIHQGIIYSVSKLSPKEIKDIELKVKKMIKVKPELINKIDPALIAGIKVEINNEIIDFTILGKLDELKQELLQGGK